MNGWGEITVQDGLETIIDYRGKTPPKSESGVPLISAKNVKAGRVVFAKPEYISPADFERWTTRGLTRGGDVLITTEAPAGEVAPHPRSGTFQISRRVMALRADEKRLHNGYLLYALQSRPVQLELLGRNRGTTVPRVLKPDITGLVIPAPPFAEQRRIAAVLRALDDKIELNRKMNRTLEEMAQALFKSWFIDFDGHDDLVDSELGPIPRGWEVTTIGESFDLTMGLSPPGSSYNEDGIGLPFFQGSRDFGFRFPTRRVYTTDARRLANAQDTLISVRAPVGRPNIAVEKCCIGRGVAALRHRSKSRSYTFAVAKHLEHRFEVFNAEGTVFGSINKKDFLRLQVVCPPPEQVWAFDAVAGTLDDRIRVNHDEMLSLVALRDTLLPKLISGELRVPEAEAALEATT
jgi:type I restriction enzyme S subunit